MKKIETHVYELSSEDIAELPDLWQVLVYNRNNGHYKLIRAKECPPDLLVSRVYLALELPRGFKGRID